MHRERSGSQEGGNSFGHIREVSEGSAGQANSGNAGFPSIPNVVRLRTSFHLPES